MQLGEEGVKYLCYVLMKLLEQAIVAIANKVQCIFFNVGPPKESIFLEAS